MLDTLKYLWNLLFINPILNALVILYTITGNLGLAIIFLTVIIRLFLVPIMVPSMRQMKKQRALQPELDKLRKKYKNNKKKQAEAQMELFKEHGLNPASGCATQIPMFLIMIALFGAVRLIATTDPITDLNARLYFDAIKFTTDYINTQFLVWDLTEPDPYYILPLLAGGLQFLVSKMTYGYTSKAQDIAKKTPDKSDDMAYNMQKQMLYVMPVITFIISINLPSGVVLYIIVTTLFTLAQTYVMLGRDQIEFKMFDFKSLGAVWKEKEITKFTENYLTELNKFFDIKPEIGLSFTEEECVVSVVGENLNFLIGSRGDSLNGLQHMLGLALYKELGEWQNVTVDINDYRIAKKEKIQDMTRSFIDRVRFFNREVEMPPMPAYDRKQVHEFVSEYDDVESNSTGEGYNRHVVLQPTQA